MKEAFQEKGNCCSCVNINITTVRPVVLFLLLSFVDQRDSCECWINNKNCFLFFAFRREHHIRYRLMLAPDPGSMCVWKKVPIAPDPSEISTLGLFYFYSVLLLVSVLFLRFIHPQRTRCPTKSRICCAFHVLLVVLMASPSFLEVHLTARRTAQSAVK